MLLYKVTSFNILAVCNPQAALKYIYFCSIKFNYKSNKRINTHEFLMNLTNL